MKPTLIQCYKKALKESYALGSFNFYNLETLRSILEAAEEEGSPVICAVSESALKYMGGETCVAMFRSATASMKSPAFLHLDHGKDFAVCKMAMDLGFDSVMIDASSLPLEMNIEETRKVVEYAHARGIQVEAELGALAGIEDDIVVLEASAKFTDPLEAKRFIKETKVDSLAIAIGTSHGAYKFKGDSRLRVDILSRIEAEIPDMVLVLHGASSVDPALVEIINQNGGSIQGSKGVDDAILRECSSHAICKINVDTDLRIAFTAGVRKNFNENPSCLNPREWLGLGKNEMKRMVKHKMKNVFGSSNRF